MPNTRICSRQLLRFTKDPFLFENWLRCTSCVCKMLNFRRFFFLLFPLLIGCQKVLKEHPNTNNPNNLHGIKSANLF